MVSDLLSRHDPDRGRHVKHRKVSADNADDRADLRRWLHGKHITPWIARKEIDSSARVGRYRWTIERAFSWMAGY